MHLSTLALALSLTAPDPAPHGQGEVVVANRADGTVTVIDVASDDVTHTVALPNGGASPEPMYVEPSAGHVFVGERANDRLVAYDPDDWSVVGTVPAGDGVFHMKADPFGIQLWVVNDVDKTLSVIDPQAIVNVATVPIPADLVALGGKPHDVAVGLFFAYVTVVGVAGDNDYVVQYNKWNFAERARAAVGKDPHVALSLWNPNLFVPAQGADAVYVLRRFNLDVVEEIPIAGAHGAWMARRGRILHTTNLPGGGTGGLVTIDAHSRNVIGTTDTRYATAHNVASTRFGNKIYVTHSGATADKVTVYRRSFWNPVPVLVGEITAGTNPFGLTYVR